MRNIQKSLGFSFVGLFFLATHTPAYQGHEESRSSPYLPGPQVRRAVQPVAPQVRIRRGPYESVQVNIDAEGNNIVSDAANEPSIAIDPTDPNKIVIGWRQFDTVASDFRQAGWAYSHDGGKTWAFPGSLDPGVFGSDPVLAASADGVFYYLTINFDESRLFRSFDGGLIWEPLSWSWAGLFDKPWMAIDGGHGIGHGNIYLNYIYGGFLRSTDGGDSFASIRHSLQGFLTFGVLTVAPDGELYAAVAGIGELHDQIVVVRSKDAGDPLATPMLVDVTRDAFPGFIYARYNGPTGGPNGGLVNQPWIAKSQVPGRNRGDVYVLCGAYRDAGPDRSDVMFVRSEDRGFTWTSPIRVNDDSVDNGAWQWFAMMSVAPNGRIDAVWNDTRHSLQPFISELYYAYSFDRGLSWSVNDAASPAFNSLVGMPIHQSKLGDYYHMVSMNDAVHVAYAATFDGEQNIYYLRIQTFDCNGNGIGDPEELALGAADVNANEIPDDCEPDCNRNGIPDDYDLTHGVLIDSNGDWIPDGCEQRLYVDLGAAGRSDGSSWENAYRDLQDALSAADQRLYVNEIWVACGVYRPDRESRDRLATFEPHGNIAIIGGFRSGDAELWQRDWRQNPTVLTCDLLGDDGPAGANRGDNCYNVITSVSDAGHQKIIDGFTITGGTGVLNPSRLGGGIHARGNQKIVLRNCTFIENASLGGQAIVAAGVELNVSRCTFRNNGSVMRTRACVVVEDGRFNLNNCVFTSNYGGALALFDSLADVHHCTVVGNKQQGILASQTALSLSSTILWENGRGGNGSVESMQLSTGTQMPPVLNFNLIQGWSGALGGVGNFSGDPRFVRMGFWDEHGTPDDLADDLWTEGDYHLRPDSPCINTGDSAVLFDPEEVDLDGHARVLCHGLDIGAYEFGIGDVTCNRRVDLLDHLSWFPCATGPESGPSKFACEGFDFNADGDIDLRDFAGFQRAFLGD